MTGTGQNPNAYRKSHVARRNAEDARARPAICAECGRRIVKAGNTDTGWSHTNTAAGRAAEAKHPAIRWTPARTRRSD